MAGISGLALGFSREALAEEAGVDCGNGRVQVDESISVRWREALSVLCKDFGKRGAAVAPGSVLRIKSDGENVIVEATLDEDRVAARRVRSPADLATVVVALTGVIPEDVPTPTPEPPPRATPPARAPAAAPPRAVVRSRADGERMRVELGLAFDGRLSGSPLYLGLGGSVYAGVRPGPWLFGVTGRWQPSELPASSPHSGLEMDSAGAGFIVLYRVLHAKIVDLDAGGSVLMLVDTQSIDTRLPDEVGSSTDARFGVLMRALFGTKGFRIAPSLDADLAPTRVRRSIHVKADLPALPAWSLALGLGVSWVDL